jgi:hypothetical protein
MSCGNIESWVFWFFFLAKKRSQPTNPVDNPLFEQAMETGEHVNRNPEYRMLVQRPASLAQGIRNTAGEAGHDDTQITGSLVEPQHRDHVRKTSQLGLRAK